MAGIKWTDGKGRRINDIGKHMQDALKDAAADAVKDIERQVNEVVNRIAARRRAEPIDVVHPLLRTELDRIDGFDVDLNAEQIRDWAERISEG